jgi:hypothetical protein
MRSPRLLPAKAAAVADMFLGLLMTQSCPRPSKCCALRNLYSMTSSARSKIDCGTVNRSAFAVLRFMAISNLVGS